MGRWDVALSYAGAQREYVEQVARALKARGLSCFYDADEQADLAGKHLAEVLPVIYGEDAALAVVFISAEYVARDWTRAESQAMFARAVRERREYVLPGRFDDTPLPGLLPDVVTVNLRKVSPEQFAAMIADKVADLGISGPVRPTDSAAARPAGAVRVSEADPRRLGVHAAISVPGITDEVLPEYVPRDADAGGSGMRARVAAAVDRGGFLLLVGGSSVGKTRCAVEAVKALLPDWWLVHPDGPAEVAALARAPLPRTLVWLDELQRYLDGEHGVTAGVIRGLLNGPHPPLIIGTLWPDYYTAYTALPAPGGVDQYARERQVLDLAAVVRIGTDFSPAEQERARTAAARDQRLKVALDSAGDGLTQILAAAPQLVARWQDARTASPYAWAALTAALDAARLGARAPLSEAFLREAAPGYCSSRQQAEAPHDWFERAMAYATGTVHGATAALTPAGAGMGQLAGYTVADYLIQQATRERRSSRVPSSTWDATLTGVRDPADIARLAKSARNRMLYRYAIPLYRRATETGGERHVEFARLLTDLGHFSEARRILDTRTDGAPRQAESLASWLASLSDLEELAAQADAGDDSAAMRLAETLANRDGLQGASAQADAGDIDGLAGRADAGEAPAAITLARLLANRGDVGQLCARADAGDGYAALVLAGMLANRGDLKQLRARADAGGRAGERYAAMKLADVLADRGDIDELRTRADARDSFAARKLADVLADRGDIDELRTRADARDFFAKSQLANRGDLDELRIQADAGDRSAARKLADMLANRGDINELRTRADADDSSAAGKLADVLAARGELGQLRARADAGDGTAGIKLADVLGDRGELKKLRTRADGGDGFAGIRLAEVLAARGELEELRARADAGDEFAAMRQADLLAARSDVTGLRERVDAGDGFAATRLPSVMIARGQREEGARLRRYGLNPDGSIAEV